MIKVNGSGTIGNWLRAAQLKPDGDSSMEYKDPSYRKNNPWRLSFRQIGLHLELVSVLSILYLHEKPAKV